MRALKAITISLGMAFALPAAADTWNLPTSGNSGANGVFTYSPPNPDWTAKAYSTTTVAGTGVRGSDASTLQSASASLQGYGGGTGVGNGVAGDVNDVTNGGNNEHAVDNEQLVDVVVFDLGSTGWNFGGLTIGFSANDSDIRVWIGDGPVGGNFNGICVNGCAGNSFTDKGLSLISSYSNVATNVSTGGNNVLTGRYIVVAGGTNDATWDAFKISSLTATKPGNPPGGGVPVPGVAALFGLGLLGLGAVRRFKRA